MHRLFLVLLLLSAVPVFADEFKYAAQDVEILHAELKADVEAELWLQQENKEMASDVLVPEEQGMGSSSSVREDPFTGSAYVVIRVSGIPVELTDVRRDAWFAPYVRAIAEQGIVSGYRDAANRPLGLFGPSDDVTIEQLAKIAVQASGLSVTACPPLKNMTAEGRWSSGIIACAEGAGWTIYSDGAVAVDRPATRAEVVVTLLQAFEEPFEHLSGDLFTDVNSTTSFGAAIEAAARSGMVAGYTDADGNPTGEFGPTNSVNRAETAKMVTLAMQLYSPM